MHINQLNIKNFRNYKDLSIEFSPNINFIIGDNGVGKTNIIEAISITSNLKSFRNITDSEIIKWGEDSYFCSSGVENNESNKFEVGCISLKDHIKKKVKIDDIVIKKASDYYGKLLTVIFTPLDINIINGGPENRRKFFDSVISKIDKNYLLALNDFKKILSSRNSLLKSLRDRRNRDFTELEIWDNMFSEKSSVIVKKRMEFLEKFNVLFKNSYISIAADDYPPEILYKPSTESEDKEIILQNLQRRRDRDIIFGSTGLGPQRDDFFMCNDSSTGFTNYASQGQRRTAAISLKVAENKIVEEEVQKKSIIIIDDIFSELDEKRRMNMIDIMKGGNQVIFTMVNSNQFEADDFRDYKKFLVKPGGDVSEV
ncbi:DNA replication/repair protein RecF [Spirochaetota bacterium]